MNKENTFIKNHRALTVFDLKVELLFDSLLKNHVDDENIIINSKGLFYRKFSKDKMTINRDAIDTDLLNIDISRDGFYDVLPESISHNYRNTDIYSNPVEEFKTRKKEEKDARNFFNPIENELFRFRHAIEQNENHFFSNLNANGIVDIIKTILVFNEDVPNELVVKMFYALLQLKDNSNQNMDEIVSILEQIINEKVTYKTSYIKLEKVNDNNDNSSDLIMGINTTLESSERIFLKKYNFIIGPLKKSKDLSKYFQNQQMESFLNNFFNLFLPFHVQYSFDVILNKKDQAFAMGEQEYKSRLGISTIL
ncbi:hypothetical protein [Flavobacterium sp. J27]|uniref:hypothetical protein n=1 Tax=Flavobacterium sp. J27 TaxID=2060419 RepID=UPI0010324E59|nr:hypothetical protein [Flavobacterium sp. J27]